MATPKPKPSPLVRPTPSKRATVKKPLTKDEIVKNLKASEARVQELHAFILNMEADAKQRSELYREACKVRDDLQAQVDKLKAEIVEWQERNNTLGEINVALREDEKAALHRANVADAEKTSVKRGNYQLRADLDTALARLKAASASADSSHERLSKIPAFIRRIFGAL